MANFWYTLGNVSSMLEPLLLASVFGIPCFIAYGIFCVASYCARSVRSVTILLPSPWTHHSEYGTQNPTRQSLRADFGRVNARTKPSRTPDSVGRQVCVNESTSRDAKENGTVFVALPQLLATEEVSIVASASNGRHDAGSGVCPPRAEEIELLEVRKGSPSLAQCTPERHACANGSLNGLLLAVDELTDRKLDKAAAAKSHPGRDKDMLRSNLPCGSNSPAGAQPPKRVCTDTPLVESLPPSAASNSKRSGGHERKGPRQAGSTLGKLGMSTYFKHFADSVSTSPDQDEVAPSSPTKSRPGRKCRSVGAKFPNNQTAPPRLREVSSTEPFEGGHTDGAGRAGCAGARVAAARVAEEEGVETEQLFRSSNSSTFSFHI